MKRRLPLVKIRCEVIHVKRERLKSRETQKKDRPRYVIRPGIMAHKFVILTNKKNPGMRGEIDRT